MIDKQFKKEAFKQSVKDNVKFLYRKTLEEATKEQVFQAVSYTVKDAVSYTHLDVYKRQFYQVVNILEVIIKSHAADTAVCCQVIYCDFIKGFFEKKFF